MALHPGRLAEPMYGVNQSALKEGDVIRANDGTYHYIQYVNSSGAYSVPLASIEREISGHTAHFTAGGRTISTHSLVEIVNPLAMGGNSQEYRRYAKMASASGRGTDMAKAKGISFASFDQSDLSEGDTGNVDSETVVDSKGTKMAKKAANKVKPVKAAKVKAAKKDKAPKTVRACVCGCGTETTGHFAPGHDARFHGWIKKLADGRIDGSGKDVKSGEKVISASIIGKLGLVKSGDGFKAKTPEFYRD